jgi:hypothetical protein
LACLTACGGSKKTSPPTATSAIQTTSESITGRPTTPNLHELRQTYLRLVKPANEALDAFQKKAAQWDKNNTTPAQAARDAAPLIAASQKLDNALLRVDWPPSTEADMKALVRAHGAVIGDLQGLGSLDLLSKGSWTNQFLQDYGKMQAAVSIVRADLGLPPSR